MREIAIGRFRFGVDIGGQFGFDQIQFGVEALEGVFERSLPLGAVQPGM